MNGRSAKRLSKTSIPSWRRLAKVKPDLLIARQGIKLKFNDFQLTTRARLAAAEQRGSDRHRAQSLG